MKDDNSSIFIIDDDEPIRRSISLLLNASGYATESFAGVEEFLETVDYSGAGCILLDIFLEGKSGLELQEEIKSKFQCLPIIYITGMGDVPMSVQALKKGAVNFLQKPIDERQLLDTIEEALHLSHQMVMEQKETSRIRSLIGNLTPREYEIFKYLITGMLNKQIAAELNITEHTVKLHRGKITEKLGVKSVAEIVQMAGKLNLFSI
ncbi:MAG TPA: response regulator [Bacteroidales bacterium]|nr:response regulator [Bacteroidales bacterium]HNS45892.1 response regulator [Bacteroidales bacterium]